MMPRNIGLVLALVLAFGGIAPAAAADDAPNRCGQIAAASPMEGWIAGTIDSETDVDWYRFALPDRRTAQFLLGGLPANYRMDIYRRCGDADAFHFHVYRPGTQFEELVMSTYYDPYQPAYVRISGVAGAFSSEPYQLRVREVPNGLSILSRDSFVANGGRHIVGEVYTTGSHRNINVTATLYDSSDVVLGTVSAPTMLKAIRWGRYRQRTPFEIVFDEPPGFDHFRLSVTGTSAPVDPVERLKITTLLPFVDEGGAGHFPGRVNNNNDFAIDNLDVFVTVYNELGGVINVGAAATAKEFLAAGERSRFDATFADHFASWNAWRGAAQARTAP